MNLLLFYGEKDYVGDKKTESILSWDSEGNLHVTALLQKYYSEKEISLWNIDIVLGVRIW